MAGHGRDRSADSRSDSLQLQTAGLTLLGVLLSIGITVGLGIGGAWWARFLAGTTTVVVLILIVGLGARPGRGPLARLASWITQAPELRRGGD